VWLTDHGAFGGLFTSPPSFDKLEEPQSNVIYR